MSRQHAAPILLPHTGSAAQLAALNQRGGSVSVSESFIQELVHAFPSSLPIAEVDEIFIDPVAICRELITPAGPIDNFMVTPSGLPVLVECKLWRNSEARREVVGQILDYAKELSRWSAADLEREVRRRLGHKEASNPVLELIREAGHDVDEVDFNDALTRNFRRGRFLLLIIGDGIREGVEAITEYLQRHAGLNFSLGLVEFPIYAMPDGSRLVAPRVLARTVNIARQVVAVPDGFTIVDDKDEAGEEVRAEKGINPRGEEQLAFWKGFLEVLKLDDREQPLPNPARIGYISLRLPPRGHSWILIYRELQTGEIGVFLNSNRNTLGETVMLAIAEDWENVRKELGGTASLTQREGRPCIGDSLLVGSLATAEARQSAYVWLAERANTFVNVLRPRVRSISADLAESQG